MKIELKILIVLILILVSLDLLILVNYPEDKIEISLNESYVYLNGIYIGCQEIHYGIECKTPDKEFTIIKEFTTRLNEKGNQTNYLN